ncbi:MAG: hypothetical protein IPJ81_15960 [Chitinophagaceae bacterium]|nr:hypothetical protein [Chitinophagaceae bacterium]
MERPKVIDKIDLDAIDSSTRPKKSTRKKEEPIVEKQPEKQEVKINIEEKVKRVRKTAG